MSDDPFDVFGSPVVSTEPSADPFDCFGPPSDTEHTAKRPCAFPSPVLPLVRRFVTAHVDAAVMDLAGADAAVLSADLSAASASLAATPSDLSACRLAAERVADSAWATLTIQGKWPHAAQREAYVLAQLMLACVCSAGADDTPGALRCLDRAFILGGPTDVYRDCVELLDNEPKPIGKECPQPAPPPHAPPPPAASAIEHPVERRPCPPSAEGFRDAQRRAVPVLFEGVAHGWPALERW